MKKFFILSLLLAGACSHYDRTHKANPDCIYDGGLKVVQVLDDGVIANMTVGQTNYATGAHTFSSVYDYEPVYIKGKDSNLYDGMMFSATSGNCWVQKGTYSYVNTMGARKTIRQLGQAPAQVWNERSVWLTEQDKASMKTDKKGAQQ